MKCAFCRRAPATTRADDGEGTMVPACAACERCVAADWFIG